MKPPLLITEVAKLANLTVGRIHQLARAGEIPGVKPPANGYNHRTYPDTTELRAWCADRAANKRRMNSWDDGSKDAALLRKQTEAVQIGIQMLKFKAAMTQILKKQPLEKMDPAVRRGLKEQLRPIFEFYKELGA